MNRFDIEVRVTPRPGLLDPQGKAIQRTLASLGFAEVADVRAGKLLVVSLHATSRDEACARATRMCEKLLANPVTEDFSVRVASDAPTPGAVS